tara:strand:- start:531 stop:839 length:309 start_codon:yes stop_codon:yes gene_type:complete
MDITVYTVNGCHYCSQMKELLRRANLEFKKVKVGEDITREEFLEEYPGAIGYPFVVIDGVEYKSLVDTAKFLVENKLVSSKSPKSKKWETPQQMWGNPTLKL